MFIISCQSWQTNPVEIHCNLSNMPVTSHMNKLLLCVHEVHSVLVHHPAEHKLLRAGQKGSQKLVKIQFKVHFTTAF